MSAAESVLLSLPPPRPRGRGNAVGLLIGPVWVLGDPRDRHLEGGFKRLGFKFNAVLQHT